MDRRHALRLLGCSLAGLAGCTGRDTAGQNVPEDGPEEPAAAPDLTSRQFSRFETYDLEEATLRIAADDLPPDPPDERRIRVTTRRYPRGTVLASGERGPIPALEDQERTVTVPLETESERAESDRADGSDPIFAHHVAEVLDSRSGEERDRRSVIAESDRFEWRPGEEPIRAPHPARVGTLSKPGFEREPIEGGYVLTVGGEGVDWRLPLRVFGAEHVRGVNGWRGHDYPPYVDQATESGLAQRIAGDVHRAALALDRDPVRFAVDLVQRLPYLPEDSDGEGEYIKYPAETLVDGGGDCEDTSILLASLLQAPPYRRECVLIHPTNHMGVGLASEDAGGTFYARDGYRYFYVETTEPGWEIGALPESYANETALVFDV